MARCKTRLINDQRETSSMARGTGKHSFVAVSSGLVLCLLAGCGGGESAPIELKGAGASFPAPLYQRWFAEYSDSHGVKVEYASAGSGAGIKQFTEKLVDFGASDAA